MKRVFLLALLVPFVLQAQQTPEPMFMNVMMTAHPAKISEFEAGLAAHNKKYHANEGNQISVFWVASGKNSGKYIWSLGPTAWSAMDEANNPDATHAADWNANVAPYTMPEMETTFWKNSLKYSNFTQDFDLKNLSIFMLDMKRFKQQEFMAVLDKVYAVFKAKDPDHQWGVYFNELPNNDGQDMVWVDFFDKSAWMSEPNKFPQWFEEVHGEGTFAGFLKDFEASTNADSQELWMYRSDLSSSTGKIIVASRQ